MDDNKQFCNISPSASYHVVPCCHNCFYSVFIKSECYCHHPFLKNTSSYAVDNDGKCDLYDKSF